MKVVFTKSKLPLSDLITWTFDEPVSHVAFVYDNKWLIQSNLLGVNIHWWNEFKNKNNIVFEIEYNLSLPQEEEIFQSILDDYAGDSYDFTAFAYFAWRGLLYKLFRVPLPKKNKWLSRGHLCTKFAGDLPRWLTNLPEDIDLEITTPYTLYQILQKAKLA